MRNETFQTPGDVRLDVRLGAGEVRVEQRRIDISLLPNPSHLEFVNPVVTGGARFLQSDLDGADQVAVQSLSCAECSVQAKVVNFAAGVVALDLREALLRLELVV